MARPDHVDRARVDEPVRSVTQARTTIDQQPDRYGAPPDAVEGQAGTIVDPTLGPARDRGLALRPRLALGDGGGLRHTGRGLPHLLVQYGGLGGDLGRRETHARGPGGRSP